MWGWGVCGWTVSRMSTHEPCTTCTTCTTSHVHIRLRKILDTSFFLKQKSPSQVVQVVQGGAGWCTLSAPSHPPVQKVCGISAKLFEHPSASVPTDPSLHNPPVTSDTFPDTLGTVTTSPTLLQRPSRPPIAYVQNCAKAICGRPFPTVPTDPTLRKPSCHLTHIL